MNPGMVYILGGGVAGLSAAHELAQRHFNVTVFEQHEICGGKARSMKNSGSASGNCQTDAGPIPRQDLPGEHGFRFFPGFYWHLTDTMQRINVGGGRTADQNLQTASQIAIAQDGKPLYFMTSSAPKTLQEWIEAIRLVIEDPSLGLTVSEARHFLRKILCFLGSGPTRRLTELERTSWWDYIDAPTHSDQYKKILGRGLSQSLVAMKPEKASALTVGAMFVQIVLNIISGKKADRVLNAPTNDAWIDPWEQQLIAPPFNVVINKRHTVKAINYDATNNVIKSVNVLDSGGTLQTFGTPADYYISAVPVDILQHDPSLFPQSFKRAAGLSRPPSTGDTDDGVDKLDTDWMNGVLFYLNRDVSRVKGHVIYADSKWALTSISQRQFWRSDFPWACVGNGQVKDILSTIISDWHTAGDKAVPKRADQCTEPEIIQEAWAQAKAHLAQSGGNGPITDADLVTAFLDPAIIFDGGVVSDNKERLLINTRDSRQHRPKATTLIPNFFVSSDYVLTETDLACMEAANESARHAVNGILTASGSTEVPCKIQPLQEPLLFKYFQDIDEDQYQHHPGQPPLLCPLLDMYLPTDTSSPSPSFTFPQLAIFFMTAASLVSVLVLLYLTFTR